MDSWKHQKVSSAPKTRRWEVQSQQRGMAEGGLITTTGLVGLLLYISMVSDTASCKIWPGSSVLGGEQYQHLTSTPRRDAEEPQGLPRGEIIGPQDRAPSLIRFEL